MSTNFRIKKTTYRFMLISLLYSVNSKIIPIKLANSALRILLLILGKLSGKEIDFSVLDMDSCPSSLSLV